MKLKTIRKNKSNYNYTNISTFFFIVALFLSENVIQSQKLTTDNLDDVGGTLLSMFAPNADTSSLFANPLGETLKKLDALGDLAANNGIV